MTGADPVDCGKSGSKVHIATDRNGLPLAAGLSATNLHDSQALQPMLRAIPRGTFPRIARKNIDPFDRLGRHHWVVERTISWLTGYRRLTIHYDATPSTAAPSPPSPQP